MERVDIVALALLINVIIFGCYIVYLRVGIKFLLDELAKHHVCLEQLSKAMEDQVNINKKQIEINKELSKALGYSPTGSRKQSN
jgi:hypothetical protein